VTCALAELAVHYPRSVVELVLAEEVRLGRVHVEAGGYRLAVEEFAPDLLAALARLGPPDPDGSGSARRVHVGARPSGQLARSFS
jgi:hypothetical protein